MKRAAVVAVAVAVTALVAPAGAGATRGYIYDVTFARGFERVSFSGDPGAGCADFGTCDYNGIVSYNIAGKPKGTIALTRSRKGKVVGRARYRTNGTTVSDVTPEGSRPNCHDSVERPVDFWSIASSGAKFKNLLVTYHGGAGIDYLATNCPGPTEADVRNAGVLPEGRFSAKDFFRGPKPRFTLKGGSPFTARGFNASIEWELAFRAKRRDCSPHCKLPTR